MKHIEADPKLLNWKIWYQAIIWMNLKVHKEIPNAFAGETSWKVHSEMNPDQPGPGREPHILGDEHRYTVGCRG